MGGDNAKGMKRFISLELEHVAQILRTRETKSPGKEIDKDPYSMVLMCAPKPFGYGGLRPQIIRVFVPVHQ